MELYGIILSVPMAFVASSIYSGIIKRLTMKWEFLTTPILWLSVLSLSLIIMEFLGMSKFGTIKLQETIGQLYYPIHVCLFLSALPSLVNVMRRQGKSPFLSKWYVIGITFAFCGLCVVLMQYTVFESLYGVDGVIGEPQGWSFIESVGGIVVGPPVRVDHSWVLPVRSDVSGLKSITRMPTMINSGMACRSVRAEVEGRMIYLTLLTTLAGPRRNAECPAALLGQVASG